MHMWSLSHTVSEMLQEKSTLWLFTFRWLLRGKTKPQRFKSNGKWNKYVVDLFEVTDLYGSHDCKSGTPDLPTKADFMFSYIHFVQRETNAPMGIILSSLYVILEE